MKYSKTKNITKEALRVRNVLITQGLEVPIKTCELDKNVRKKLISKYIKKIMILLNLDLKNKSILNTSDRIADIYINQIFSGLDYYNFPKINFIKNDMKMKEMITIDNISMTSTCEHHFSIINGKVKISYIPESYIVGLSNINEIVYFFSQRPQLQERLTKQLSIALQTILRTRNIAISINAKHHCMKYKNTGENTSTVYTLSLDGVFKVNTNFRKEFLRFS